MLLSHRAWLSAHPERTAEWLAAKIVDGFEIHHLDEDRTNNNPTNLVLLEGLDHKRIHGISGKLLKATNSGRRGGILRHAMLSPEALRKHQSRAAKAKWRKFRRDRRAKG